jgi:aspartyl-tRNA(Asn)/glutamyl-tRNA(Gln) amidotransferase subunit A
VGVPEPFELTASKAAAAIRSGRLSPVDLVESLLDRIARLDPAVRAWVRLDGERARSSARALATEAAEWRSRGLLHGVPVGLKDIYFTEGLGTEAGSPLYEGFVPKEDAATVARLRRAGAIVLGKTETTQFAMGDPAPTRNPWNLEHTPGGSSSGSAAAVAARMVPAALGTQTAGSVLRPASFCGVVGFKPSAGRYSLEGIFPLAWTLDHPGTFTRSVVDARLFFSVLDEFGERRRRTPRDRAPRLGFLRGRFIDQADAGALDQVESAAGRLAAAGAVVIEVSLPDDFDLAVEVHHVIMATEAAAYHAANHLRQPDAYRPVLRTLIETGSLVPAGVYLQAQQLRKEVKEAIAALFQNVDCLAMPSALGTAPEGLESTGNPVFNAPWSLVGVPSLSIPCGLSAAGLPYGLQLIGRFGADLALLDAGEWCERHLWSLPLPSASVAATPAG